LEPGATPSAQRALDNETHAVYISTLSQPLFCRIAEIFTALGYSLYVIFRSKTHDFWSLEANVFLQHQIEQYKSDGYFLYKDLLSESQVAHFLSEIDRVCAGSTVAEHDSTRLEMEPNQPLTGKRVRRVYEPCTYYEVFKSYSESQELLDPLEQILGPDIVYTSSKINVKPAEIGSVVEWHQDMAYGPLTNRSVVALLIYLDDADIENGCLQVIPGSVPMLKHSRDGVFQGRITEPLDTSKAVHLPGKKGTALFFNGLAPHASSPNISSRPRRTLILGYRAADAFPIHLGEQSVKSDQFARIVRGHKSEVARFDMDRVYVPNYPTNTKSLYELQDLSRRTQPSQVA